MTATEIIDFMNLEPLPVEGGFYRETYRSSEVLTRMQLRSDIQQDKHIYTVIYYLLTPETKSTLHALPTDEIFHFYLGDPVTMLNLFEDGTSAILTLGQDILKGHHVQFKVPGNTWQGSILKAGGSFALMGTTMAPGFDFADFQAANREALIDQYPDQREMIERLTDG